MVLEARMYASWRFRMLPGCSLARNGMSSLALRINVKVDRGRNSNDNREKGSVDVTELFSDLGGEEVLYNGVCMSM